MENAQEKTGGQWQARQWQLLAAAADTLPLLCWLYIMVQGGRRYMANPDPYKPFVLRHSAALVLKENHWVHRGL